MPRGIPGGFKGMGQLIAQVHVHAMYIKRKQSQNQSTKPSPLSEVGEKVIKENFRPIRVVFLSLCRVLDMWRQKSSISLKSLRQT